MSRQSEWIRVTKVEPCLICKKPDYCGVSADGRVACCMRVESEKRARNGGWIHVLKENPVPYVPVKLPQKKRLSDSELHDMWMPKVDKLWDWGRRPLKGLAAQLGVAPWALDALLVGYGPLQGTMCYSFPEWNHKRQIIGINRRPVNGGKQMCVQGGRRGLTYANDFADYTGPIHIVEGGSDTAAGLTLGLCVVGRPSCTGGKTLLVRLLGPLAGRRIVVLAERDRKKSEGHNRPGHSCMQCWPGKYGAMDLALYLQQYLSRKVEWRFLPDGAKDLREWLQAQQIQPGDQEAAFELGRKVFKKGAFTNA